MMLEAGLGIRGLLATSEMLEVASEASFYWFKVRGIC